MDPTTPYEQFMLELVNRARSQPLDEAMRYDIDLNEGLDPGTIAATPKSPLFMNPWLVDAARDYSDAMLETNTFSHTGVDGSSPGDRMEMAGYEFVSPWGWGENISWQGTTGTLLEEDLTGYILDQHEGLFLSSGHRTNILGEDYKEIGIGQRLGDFTSDGTTYDASMITQNYAFAGDEVYLGGVAYQDFDADAFYTPGEGLEGITISIPEYGIEAQTSSAGGYQFAVPTGIHEVIFSGDALSEPVFQLVDVDAENVKLDLVLDIVDEDEDEDEDEDDEEEDDPDPIEPPEDDEDDEDDDDDPVEPPEDDEDEDEDDDDDDGPIIIDPPIDPTPIPPTHPIFDRYSSQAQSPEDLLGAMLGDITGISIVDGSVSYQGADAATSIFESFDFGDVVRMSNSGILLTSGDGAPPLANTEAGYTRSNGASGDTQFDALAQAAFDGAGTTNDASILEFQFAVDDPTVQSVSFDLIFGSEEYPNYVDSSFVDIAAVLVNDVNYGLFEDDPEKPLSIIGNSVGSGSFFDNMDDQYSIEYNGISPRLSISVPTTNDSGVYDVRIGVADTGDYVLDSALFVSNFSTSIHDLEGLRVEREANPGGGVVEPAGPDTATIFRGGLGDDIFQGSTASDVYDLQDGGGENVIRGNAEQLDGDTIIGFGLGDSIQVLESSFTEDDIEYDPENGRLIIDTDADGVKETEIDVELHPDASGVDDGFWEVTKTEVGTAIGWSEKEQEPPFPDDHPIFDRYSSQAQSPEDLLAAILGDITGISIVDGSVNYQGADAAASRFDSFDFGGSVRMPNSGILLTSGDGAPPLKNTEQDYTRINDAPGDAQFDALAQAAFVDAGPTNDASILEFQFTVDDPTVQSVSFDLIFGSEEYPEFVDSSFVDIAAVLVNDVNHGLFDGDPEKPLSVIGNSVDSGSFLDNIGDLEDIDDDFYVLGTNEIEGETALTVFQPPIIDDIWPVFPPDDIDSPYSIEYNGISPRLSVNVPMDGSDVYDVRIGVADTGDYDFDSGLFVSNFSTSRHNLEGLQVEVEADPDGGLVEAAGAGMGTFFVGGASNDIFQGSTAIDIYDLQAGGADTIQGSGEQLHNDVVLGFGLNDRIKVLGASLAEEDLSFNPQQGILTLDTNDDGSKETSLILDLQTDFEQAVFEVEQVGSDSLITYSDPTIPAPPSAEPDPTVYVRAFMQELATLGNGGEEATLIDALAGVFTGILTRQLSEGSDGQLSPGGAFNVLAPIFTFVATAPGDRPVAGPMSYGPPNIDAAHTAAQNAVANDLGAGGDPATGVHVESVELVWDGTFAEYAADADALREENDTDHITFELSIEPRPSEDGSMLGVSGFIDNFTAGDTLDLSNLNLGEDLSITDSSYDAEEGALEIDLQVGDFIFPFVSFNLENVDPDALDLDVSDSDNLVASLETADWLVI